MCAHIVTAARATVNEHLTDQGDQISNADGLHFGPVPARTQDQQELVNDIFQNLERPAMANDQACSKGGDGITQLDKTCSTSIRLLRWTEVSGVSGSKPPINDVLCTPFCQRPVQGVCQGSNRGLQRPLGVSRAKASWDAQDEPLHPLAQGLRCQSRG